MNFHKTAHATVLTFAILVGASRVLPNQMRHERKQRHRKAQDELGHSDEDLFTS